MNPFNLKAEAAAYHKKTAADLTVNSQDLFLSSLNRVVRRAELKHNFEFTRVQASLDIDGTIGGSLDNAIIAGDVAEAVTITGTLTPDATGVYPRVGNFNARPLYVLAGTTTYFLYYSTSQTSYVLATSLTNAALTNFWTPVAIQVIPVGTYAHQGSYTGTATVAQTVNTQWSGFKEVVAILRAQLNGVYVPLDFTRADIPIERDRTTRELTDNYWPFNKYPSDADILNVRGNASIIQRGRTLAIYPSPTQVVSTTPLSVILEGYAWLTPVASVGLTGDADPNFLYTYGADWLLFSIICELNLYFKTFVGRTEGNLAPPTDLRDAAWEELMDWDNNQVDYNATRSR